MRFEMQKNPDYDDIGESRYPAMEEAHEAENV